MQGRNICIEVEVLEGGRTDVAVIQTDRHLLILMFRDEQ